MRYFVPDIELAGATNVERLGGVPFGLPLEKWPKCAECGGSQTLLAEFRHDPERLNLGREGRVLFVFQCAHDPGMCATWEAFSGANACFVLEPEELGDRETPAPADRPPEDPGVAITAWQARDDEVAAADAPAYFEERAYNALGEAGWRKPTFSTRLGSVPTWIQSADEWPGPPWRFAGQLDETYSFQRPPAPQSDWVRPDPETFEGRTHVAQGPNFGAGGLAYLFLRDEGESVPQGCMFWQCG